MKRLSQTLVLCLAAAARLTRFFFLLLPPAALFRAAFSVATLAPGRR